jgi:Flp pilus assembly protein TadG
MSWLRRFLKNKSANVGVLFAISVTPILGVTGAAVDYMRASSARTELQAAADAAAIAGVIADAPNDSARISLAQSYLAANISNADLVSLPLEEEGLETAVALNRGVMTVHASGAIETVMIKLLGIDTIPITVTAQAIKDRNSMPVCVLALNKAASKAINFAGNSTFIANK